LDSAFRVHLKALQSATDIEDPVAEAYARFDKACLLKMMKRPRREVTSEIRAALKLATQCEMALLIEKCNRQLGV